MEMVTMASALKGYVKDLRVNLPAVCAWLLTAESGSRSGTGDRKIRSTSTYTTMDARRRIAKTEVSRPSWSRFSFLSSLNPEACGGRSFPILLSSSTALWPD